ncbi:MAG: cysteine desulfurase family protein [Planctomycetota bacterium]
MEFVYLDNNATTRPADQVVEAMNDAQRGLWANPSSVHRQGQAARQKVELARASVASLIQTHPRQVVFTSGGTESDNLAIRGVLGGDDGVLITSRVEHSAVREPAEVFAKRGEVVWLPVGAGGVIDPAAVADALAVHAGRTVLVSVQWANNETGTIQPVRAIADAVAEACEAAPGRARVYLHADACQAVGKLPVDVEASGVDLLSLSGHKLHGPKGVGALYVRRGLRLRRQVHGGPQELQRRGGTENTAGIIGLGVSAELAEAFLADGDELARLAALRDRFEASVLDSVPGAVVNGLEGRGPAERLWNTSNIAFPGLEAEAILLGLSERGVCASAGAACSSGSLEPSPVLLAMGVPEPVAHGSVRFSLSRETTLQEIDRALAVLPEVVGRLGRVMPTG